MVALLKSPLVIVAGLALAAMVYLRARGGPAESFAQGVGVGAGL